MDVDNASSNGLMIHDLVASGRTLSRRARAEGSRARFSFGMSCCLEVAAIGVAAGLVLFPWPQCVYRA